MKRGKAEKLLKDHGSPPGLRVTAGGRIVPSNLPSLTSPFQYPTTKGFRPARFPDHHLGQNGEQTPSSQLVSSGDLLNNNANGEYNLYNGVSSSNPGLPMFNPVSSYGGFWSGYGYNFPWNAPYPGQFSNPYGYLVPMPVVPSSRRSHTASEETNPFVKPTAIPILQQKVMLESQHEKLKKEKQELDKDEIRQSQVAPISEAEKRNIAAQRKLFILQLDSLRKDIIKIQQKIDQGHQSADSTVLNPVTSTGSRQTDSVTVSTSPNTNVARRKSHAIEIKPPSHLKLFKSALNTTSPSYEPSKLVPVDHKSEHISPQTPSPLGTDDTVYSNTVVASKRKPSDRQSATSTTVLSNSSPSTTDFFPNSAAEHSNKKYHHHGTESTDQATSQPVSTISIPPQSQAPQNSNNLATQPNKFWMGFFDRGTGSAPRPEAKHNPNYIAGYGEAALYTGIIPRAYASFQFMYVSFTGLFANSCRLHTSLILKRVAHRCLSKQNHPNTIVLDSAPKSSTFSIAFQEHFSPFLLLFTESEMVFNMRLPFEI
jgi:hypothetical protein